MRTRPRGGAGAAAPPLARSAMGGGSRGPAPRGGPRSGGAKPHFIGEPGFLYLILGHYSVRAMRLTVKNGRDITHNGLVYSYPDGSQDVLCCTSPIFREPGWEAAGWAEPEAKPRPAAREAGKKSEGADMERSMRRARAKLRRLALANDFDYFVTLTLDPARIDRYDGAAITRALGWWADNMVRRHGLRYVLVPERHKDGAFHFHGFVAGPGLKAVDSGKKWNGRTVYNLPQWTLGFTTAEQLYGDYYAAVGYCCKYIGKQDAERPLGRWYYSGGALKEPAKLYCDLDYRAVENSVEFSIPGAKLKISHDFGGKKP